MKPELARSKMTDAKDGDSGLSPLTISSILHVSLATLFGAVIAFGNNGADKVEILVYENPVVAAPQLNLNQPPPAPPPKTETRRKVYGVSTKALTSDEPGPGVSVKQGTTLATAPDNLQLKPSDEGPLPIPTDEYLITKMPSVVNGVQIPYPPEARQRKTEGKVVMELLIDETGHVREAKLVSGPGFGLNEAAVAAVTRFQFRPAEVDGRPVAARIPFTYNFLLKSD